MDNNVYDAFSKWIEGLLSKKLPTEIKAFNFNLYEGKDSFHVQLIGSSSFSEEDSDWACDEIYSSGENIFIISNKKSGTKWQDALNFSKEVVQTYLEKGNKSNLLKASNAVAIGFVDGDLEILYKK